MASDPSKIEPSVQQQKEACQKLLKKCKLDDRKLRRLFSVLEKYRQNASSPEKLISKFAQKCYMTPDGDLNHAIKIATNFVKTAFGSVNQLYTVGPETAFQHLVNLGAKQLCANMWEFEFGKYFIGHQIGVGGTARVYLGEDKGTNEQVAVKVYMGKHAINASKEGNILKKLDHRNIINVYDVYENCNFKGKKTTVMVMEYANQGELIDYLMYTKRFEPPLARWVFRGLLQAVMYCHAQDPAIIHRDLKHDNALFSDTKNGDFVVKINDFGFSHRLDKGQMMKTMLGTPEYAAPELLKGELYDGQCDTFSLGVMLFVMLAGVQPFKRADKKDKWYKYVVQGRWDKFWAAHTNRKGAYQFSKDELDLLKGMLAYNPKERCTLEEVSAHDWLVSDEAKRKTYSSRKAKQKLNDRKNKVDYDRWKAASTRKSPSNEDTRDIDPDNVVIARPYHTNLPRPGLWFYSTVSPPQIIETIDAVIKNDLFKGNTDYSELMDVPSAKDSEQTELDNKEEEEVSGGEFKSLMVDTANMTAIDAMALGQHRINFSVSINKKTERGVATVYSCPDKPELNIVMFQPGIYANTLAFPQIYSNFLSGDQSSEYAGIASLMIPRKKVIEELEDLEILRVGNARRYSVETAPDLSFEEE